MNVPAYIPPSQWQPQSYADLIGPAADLAEILEDKAERMRSQGSSARIVLSGPPGVGKSALAKIAALDLAQGETLNIEAKSGLMITVEVVKAWQGSLGMGSLFAGHQVKLIHELDRVNDAAQILLLDYLDQIQDKPDTAFIGTSNAEIQKLQERFQTRLQFFPVEGPEPDEIAELLTTYWPVTPDTARMIAAGSCGNVRAALLDLESHLDVQYSRARRGKLKTA